MIPIQAGHVDPTDSGYTDPRIAEKATRFFDQAGKRQGSALIPGLHSRSIDSRSEP